MRGGRRRGAGRKKGSPNKRKRTLASAQAEVALAAAQEGTTPLAHMLSVLNNPNAPEARKDQMAAAAAPYMHPKLNLSATSEVNGAGCIGEVSIVCVPRGAQFNSSTGMIKYDDGLEISPPPFTSLEPTPDVVPVADTDTCLPEPVPPAQPEPAPLEVYEPVDDGKVESLARWRRRDEPSGSA